MKNCKKILAMMLTLVMVISMCAFTVSADRITHATPSSETEIIVWDAEYWAEKNDTITKASKTVYFENSKEGKLISTNKFGLTSKALTGSSVSKVDDPLDESKTNKVLKLDTNWIQCNFRYWFNDDKTNAMGDNDALSFKARMMIPSVQPEGVTKTDYIRLLTVPFATRTYDDTYKYDNGTHIAYATLNVSIKYNDDNKLVATASPAESKYMVTGQSYSNPVVVEEDAYFTVNAECVVKDGQRPVCFVYVNDELIYSATVNTIFNKSETVDGVTTKSGLTFGDIVLKQSNAGNTINDATMYLDEVKISAHKAETFPVYSIGTTKSADTITAEAGKSADIMGSTGFYGKSIVNSSFSSTASATYSRDTSTVAGETLIDINTTSKGVTRALVNIREPISDIPFVSIDENSPIYLVNSADIYIPEGTEKMERQFGFATTSAVRAEGVTDDVLFKGSTATNLITIKDGKVKFSTNIANTVVEKNFVSKSETVDFPSNTLVTVKTVCEVTGTEAAGYNVKVYGLVEDNLIYESEFIYPAGEFGFSSMYLDITNSSKTDSLNTKLDDYNLVIYKNYTIPEKTWNLVDYAYQPEATVNGNNVNVKGLIVNSSTDKLDAVVAFYDVNGKLIAPLAKTTLTKSGNDFSIEANAEIPEGAATAKVFFFDSLATAKPVMKSAKITIE